MSIPAGIFFKKNIEILYERNFQKCRNIIGFYLPKLYEILQEIFQVKYRNHFEKFRNSIQIFFLMNNSFSHEYFKNLFTKKYEKIKEFKIYIL